MIPKKIHYCWFGGKPLPKAALKCINSWKKYCPDYEIIEWNEKNFDINLNEYTKMCYEQKKFAFLSDFVRLFVVLQNGGIYFDIDVELVKSPDFLLNHKSFFGFETIKSINTGLGFGAEKGNTIVESMLKEYDPLLDGKNGVVMCPKLNTNAAEKAGLILDGLYQEFDWGTIYPKDYFNPYESTTGRLYKTKNTVSIHWYKGSCLTKTQKLRSVISKPLHRIFGDDCFKF
jgi:mannosyltransferase OCH1-like enzyme